MKKLFTAIVLFLVLLPPAWGADGDPFLQGKAETEEGVEDIVGGMVTGNTETGITVAYEDDDGTLDFTVTGVKSTSTTGLVTFTGPGAGETRSKTVRDADDTILELGGSYTPTGTWTNMGLAPKVTISDSETTAPLNLTERSAAPSVPAAGDVYLDDGTNTSVGTPALRMYDGTNWKNIPSSQLHNIVDYGAVADSSGSAATNVTAFNAAIDAQQISGGWVYVPRGTWYINDTIDTRYFVYNNVVKIMGEGWSSLIRWDTADQYLIKFGGVIGPIIRDVSFQNNTAADSLTSGALIYISPEIGFHSGANNAPTLTASNDDGAMDFDLSDHVGRTLYNLTDNSSCTIGAGGSCTLSGGEDDDWDINDLFGLLYDISYGRIENVTFYGGYANAELVDVKNMVIENCTFENEKMYGLYFNSKYSCDSGDNLISGCRFKANYTGYTSTDDTSSSNATTMTDSSAEFVVDSLIGGIIRNIDDEEECEITDNTATTVVCSGGGMDWDSEESYFVTADTSGTAHIQYNGGGLMVQGNKIQGRYNHSFLHNFPNYHINVDLNCTASTNRGTETGILLISNNTMEVADTASIHLTSDSSRFSQTVIDGNQVDRILIDGELAVQTIITNNHIRTMHEWDGTASGLLTMTDGDDIYVSGNAFYSPFSSTHWYAIKNSGTTNLRVGDNLFADSFPDTMRYNGTYASAVFFPSNLEVDGGRIVAGNATTSDARVSVFSADSGGVSYLRLYRGAASKTDISNQGASYYTYIDTASRLYNRVGGDVYWQDKENSYDAMMTLTDVAGAGGANLTVYGDITVDSCTGCADYVFESSYDLMSLDELNIFIKQNKHLPNMTMNQKEKGVTQSITKATSELLEKTEEQALYILQLHEQNKKLVERLEKLEAKLQ